KNGDTAFVVQALGFVWVLVATTVAVVWIAAIAALVLGTVILILSKVGEALAKEAWAEGEEGFGCVVSAASLILALYLLGHGCGVFGVLLAYPRGGFTAGGFGGEMGGKFDFPSQGVPG
ncbi:MAG: hypothetical protein ACK42L_10945, partial [Thermoanaerobaculum sp.]